MRLLAIHFLQIVHLMQQKIRLIVTEANIAWKDLKRDLRDHALKIIDYGKKEMIPLINEEIKSYEEQKVSYICKKEFSTNDEDDDGDGNKKCHKVRDHFHYTGKFRGAAYNICNLRYKISI